MQSLKYLMAKFSYRQKTVKSLKKIVSQLSKRFINIDRKLLKGIGIYCTRSALNKRELIKVIDWFVAIVAIGQYDFIHLIASQVFDDSDLALIFEIKLDQVAALIELFHFYGSVYSPQTDRKHNVKILPANSYISGYDGRSFYPHDLLFDKWDKECRNDDKVDDFISRTNGTLWQYGNIVSFAPKYVSKKLLRRVNFDKEVFCAYQIHIRNCSYLFEIDIPWAHQTFCYYFKRIFRDINNN